MSTSSTDPSARTPIPPVLPAEDLSGASGDLGLFAGRLPGVREYSRSACGELVPFRRVDLDPTPASFGGGVQPAIYLCDVTGPFGEGDGSQNHVCAIVRLRAHPRSTRVLARVLSHLKWRLWLNERTSTAKYFGVARQARKSQSPGALSACC